MAAFSKPTQFQNKFHFRYFLRLYIELEIKRELKIPLASSLSYGEMTFNPGQCEYHAAKHCECCAPTPAAAPFGPLKTIGTFTLPADM